MIDMKTLLIVSTLLALGAAGSLSADQVTMKNGDRLTGAIQKFDGKNLVIQSELAGTVTIPWDAVTAVESSAPLSVGLADGQTLLGVVSASGSQVQVRTAASGVVNTPRSAVTSLRSKEEEAAYQAGIERLRNPSLIDLWAGYVDLGYARATGNAKTSSVNVNANANRATTRDKTSVYFTSINAANTTAGKSETTANAMRGGIRYELNVSPKLFGFGSTDLEFDEFQNLDLRLSPAGGFGYHAVKTEHSVFDLMGGGGLNKEFFSTGLRRTSGEGLAGEDFTWKLSSVTSLHRKRQSNPSFVATALVMQ